MHKYKLEHQNLPKFNLNDFALEKILKKAMHPDKRKRFRTAEKLITKLSSVKE